MKRNKFAVSLVLACGISSVYALAQSVPKKPSGKKPVPSERPASVPAREGQQRMPASRIENDAYWKFRKALVLIVTDEKVGTGFFVQEGIIVTAAHVIQGQKTKVYWLAGGCFFNSDPPIKEWPQACELETESIVVKKGADLAILRTKKTSADMPTLPIMSPSHPPIGAEIGMLGFPLRTISGEKTLYPILSTGVISFDQGYASEDGFATYYWADAISTGGFSGGPVFLLPGGEIIGVVSARNPTLDPVGVSFSFVSSITNLHEQLENLRIPPVGTPPRR